MRVVVRWLWVARTRVSSSATNASAATRSVVTRRRASARVFCAGDSSQTRGGPWANTIYPTGKPTLMGCFADGSSRDLSGPAETSSTDSPEQCAAWCNVQGFKYAGLQDGNQCFCGNSFGSYGVSNECSSTCSGDPTSLCGGSWANSVYATGGPGIALTTATYDHIEINVFTGCDDARSDSSVTAELFLPPLSDGSPAVAQTISCCAIECGRPERQRELERLDQ